jgi:hypothetical protein
MRSRLFLAFAATAVAACSSPTGGGGDPDASVTPSDVPAVDVPAVTDAPAADVPRDAPRDAPTGPTCNGAPIENVETLGMRSGTTLRYSDNNRSASNSTTRGIQSGTTTAPCNFRTQFQRVFSYTLRGNSSLRVSTSNPGTSADFDTTLVLYNGRTCPTSFRTLYCNDDDPGAAMAANRFTSRIITQGFAMGDTVLIGVGGYAVPSGQMSSGEPQGNFELTIEELPLIADGAACRRDGTTGACGIDSTCVAENILADAGACRANGSAPGARCSMTTCGMGLECDTERDLCFRRMPDGMPCDRFSDGWARCGATSNCVSAGNGNVSGTCRAFGSAANTECAAGAMCATGLACRAAATTPTCGRPADMDGRCNATDSVCPTGQSCVSDDPAVFQGRCFEPGAALGAPCTGTCGQGLTCNTAATTPTCVRAVMTGERCSAREPCPTGNTCYLTNLVDRYHGTCFAPGVVGGPCRATGAACDMGVCSNTETPASGRCLREVAMGGACELVGPTRCATGTTCVRNVGVGGSTTMGTCREAGTAAGAACRAMGTRCDGTLVCSSMTGAGICQQPGTGVCEPRFNVRRVSDEPDLPRDELRGRPLRRALGDGDRAQPGHRLGAGDDRRRGHRARRAGALRHRLLHGRRARQRQGVRAGLGPHGLLLRGRHPGARGGPLHPRGPLAREQHEQRALRVPDDRRRRLGGHPGVPLGRGPRRGAPHALRAQPRRRPGRRARLRARLVRQHALTRADQQPLTAPSG